MGDRDACGRQPGLWFRGAAGVRSLGRERTKPFDQSEIWDKHSGCGSCESAYIDDAEMTQTALSYWYIVFKGASVMKIEIN